MSDRLSNLEKEALWERIASAHVAKAPGPAARPPRARAMAYVGVAAAAAAALLLYARRAETTTAPGPLLYADSHESPANLLFGEHGGRAQFSDKSSIEAHDGAHLEVLDNAALRFALKQTRGRAYFSVTPGGTRHWTVDTPLATVEVVGTAFEVEASSEHVRVHVEHGVVIVRGDRVPGHALRLVDGQSTDVFAAPPAQITEAPATAEPHKASAPPNAVGQASPTPSAEIESPEQARVSELLLLADVLRAQGKQEAAAAALKQLVLKHPSDARAALAAFTLGRMEQDSLRNDANAVWAFERALKLGLPTALKGDAQQRIEELERNRKPAEPGE